ncbi:hypothetical protein MTO96_042323 [Rhipicephalus appendiculatus]
MLLSKSTQTAASTDNIFTRAPECADVHASPMLPKFFENDRCSTPVPCVEEMECESPEFAGDETYRPSLESFEESFGSGCMEPGELASQNDEDITAAAAAQPPLALDSQTENEPTVPSFREERKFVVFESCLRQLLPVECNFCHTQYASKFSVVGSMLTVKSSCNNCGHMASWQSQPLIGDKPAGNVLLAAAILFSGCTVAQVITAPAVHQCAGH